MAQPRGDGLTGANTDAQVQLHTPIPSFRFPQPPITNATIGHRLTATMPASLTLLLFMLLAPCLQVRNKHTGQLLVLKVIQFDVSSDIIRKQVRIDSGIQLAVLVEGQWVC